MGEKNYVHKKMYKLRIIIIIIKEGGKFQEIKSTSKKNLGRETIIIK